MEKILFHIILVPVLCTGRITINIVTGSNFADTKISHSGIDNKLITDREESWYNITKESLNRGIRIELGKKADDIFWQDPTPYANLFEEYGWPPVKRHMEIIDEKVVQIITERAVLKLSDHWNNTTKTISSKISTTEIVENTVFTTWSLQGIPDDDIYLDININFNKEDFHYKDMWRNESFISAVVPFGVEKERYNKTVMIKPGQTVTAKLTGLKTIILFEIDYLAKLVGNIIIDYAELVYGKYHFYSPTVNNIMKAAKMNNEIRTTQFLEIRCFTDPKLEVYDKKSGDYVQFTELNHFHPKKKGRLHNL